MTHTNHREGSLESLRHDFVVMVMPAKGYNNDEEAPLKLKKALRIFLRHNAVNAGAIKAGYLVKNSPEEMEKIIGQDTPMIHGTFTNEADVEEVVKELKEEDMGLSVVVSGVIERVWDIAKKAGITPHSVEFSLGLMGKRELLAEDYLRPLMTMCGHGLISRNLAKSIIEDVKRGLIDSSEGARRLAAQCVCGIFNLDRAKKLIEEAASSAVHFSP
ncbi:MAG TPA: hypothetical protein GX510_05365 [Firmicutes bacterium]|nr:hypothetical protein [Candidatus Fermentithermobacillaceae bacterium]